MKGLKYLIVALLFFLVSSTSYAFDWTASNVQFLYGSDFEFGIEDRTTTTVEHANGWSYGQNFSL
jgi:hypothetical protein